MEKDNIFDTFSILSKIVIILPIIVVVTTLILKFNQKPTKVAQVTPSPTMSPSAKPSSKINIDLQGPLICQSKLEEASISAYIKDKKIKVAIDKDNQIENILVSGDCFYNWEDNEYTGRRICGLSPLFSVAQTMMSLGLVGADTLFSQLNSLGIDNKIATDPGHINQLLNSCQKRAVEESVFIIPQNVLFRNTK